MRSLISLLLVLSLLCTCVFAIDPGEIAEQGVQQVLDRLSDLTDQTRTMTDEELAETIQSIAAEYHLTFNQEQLDFLISACRGLETADDVGTTVQDAGQKVSKFRQTVRSILDALAQMVQAIGAFFARIGTFFQELFA